MLASLAARVLMLLCLVFAASLVIAQQRVVVNGQELSDASSRIVPGRAYAPLDSYAAAVGFEVAITPGMTQASFSYGGRVYTLMTQPSAPEAARSTRGITVDGQVFESPGSLIAAGRFYVPVRDLSLSLGATVDFIAAQNTVLVVFPRAQLLTIIPSTGDGTHDRLRLRFDSLTSMQEYRIPGLNFVRLRFDRTDLLQERRFTGLHFREARFQGLAGQLDLLIELRDGAVLEAYSTPTSSGFEVVVDVFAGSQSQSATTNTVDSSSLNQRIVIDPAHGGPDRGQFFPAYARHEDNLTFVLAQQLVAALSASNRELLLTRSSDSIDDALVTLQQRSQQGIGSDLFISLQVAELASRQINVYYLGEAESLTHLNMAIERNAEDLIASLPTDSLRREILLQSLPNLAKGQQYAAFVSSELRARGYQSSAERAPLYVLRGAAGHGLLIEMSVQDSLDSGFQQSLVSALQALVDRGLD